MEEFHEIEPEIRTSLSELLSKIEEIAKLLEVENQIFEMMKRVKVLKSTELTEVNDAINLTNQTYSALTELNQGIELSLKKKQAWFEPWSGMLEFIQLTEDGKEIQISQIAEIMRTSIDHAEGLLTPLLKQNSFIGTYDKSKKTYSKGTNVNDYLEKMLANARTFDEESAHQ